MSAQSAVFVELFAVSGLRTTESQRLLSTLSPLLLAHTQPFPSEYEPPIQVVTTGFVGGSKDSAEASAEILHTANVRIGFVIGFDQTYGYFMDKAEELGMTGPGYFWLAGDGVGNAKVQSSTTKQINGIGKMLSLGGVPGASVYDQFKANWDGFDNSAEGTALKTYAEAMWLDPWVGNDGTTDLSVFSDTFFADNVPDDVATYAYDAVMQHGIGACAYKAAGGTFDADFAAADFFAAVTATEFTSVTGSVRFLSDTTGSRDPASSNFILYNWQCEGETCTQYTAGSWTALSGWDYSGGDTPGGSFRFSDNTLNAPSDRGPPPYEEKNLLGGGLVGIGVMLVGLNYCIAAALGGMTFWKRKDKVIRASQPMFLAMVLIGCCVSTTTILFFSQDDSGDYDKDGEVDCMMQPIFYSLGFTFR